jgi:hypothetical protein
MDLLKEKFDGNFLLLTNDTMHLTSSLRKKEKMIKKERKKKRKTM